MQICSVSDAVPYMEHYGILNGINRKSNLRQLSGSQTYGIITTASQGQNKQIKEYLLVNSLQEFALMFPYFCVVYLFY